MIEQMSKRELTAEDLKKQLAEQYQEQIKYYAKYDGFRISIQDEYENWPSIGRLFRYHKITALDFASSKEMIHNWRQDAEPLEFSSESDVQQWESEMIISAEGFVQQTLDYYKFLASCYLHMTSKEFERCDWSKLRLVIEACIYRTEHSIATFSTPLLEFFTIENARGEPMAIHLTPKDIDMLNMYQLWVGESKLKPWDINGGIIYQEDISTFLKLEEYRLLGEKKKAKLREARERSASGGGGATMGPDGVLHKHTTRIRNR